MLKNSSNESETLQKRSGVRALALALSLTLLLPALSPSMCRAEAKSTEKTEKKVKSEKKEKVEKAAKTEDTAKTKVKSEKKAKSEDKTKPQTVELSKEDQPLSEIGLPGSIARLINQGRWREASQQLEARVKKEKDVN